MKDFLGRELSIGDSVVTTPRYYRGLVRAEVIAFKPKQVRMRYKNTWNYGEGKDEEYLAFPSSVVKILVNKDDQFQELLAASKDFYNHTIADPEVILRTKSMNQVDVITRSGERLRSAIKNIEGKAT